MIIDVHSHIGTTSSDWPRAFEVATAKDMRLFFTRGRPWKEDLTSYLAVYDTGQLFDIDGEKSYKRLKEFGIDKAVLLPIDMNLMGLNRYRMKADYLERRPIEEMNKQIADIAAKHPDMYIPFASVDPRRGQQGLEMVVKTVRDGAKGLKLFPDAGWLPNDRAYYPYYELCVDLDLPVLTHCGYENSEAPGRFSDPSCWEDVLTDIPELRVCLGHGGGAVAPMPGRHYLDVTLSLLIRYDNVYMELAGGQSMYMRDPIDFYRVIRRILDWAAGKVLWGTDNPPVERRGLTWKGYLDVFLNPKPELLEKAGVSFTKEEMDWLLGENAKQWLKLKD